MSQYVYQRTGGPLIYWGGGQPPRQSRAAQAKNGLNGLGCGGGGCGCDDCGAAKTYPSGMSGGYPEYGAPRPGAIAVPTRLSEPRGAARTYRSSLGTVPFIPGAPEPLTSDVTDLINPYQPPSSSSSSFPWGKVILGGLALAVAYPHLKKLIK